VSEEETLSTIMGSPQQLKPIAALLRRGLGSPDPALMLSFTKKSFKPNLKSRPGVCLLNPNWELVPQKRGLKAEGSHLGTACKPAV